MTNTRLILEEHFLSGSLPFKNRALCSVDTDAAEFRFHDLTRAIVQLLIVVNFGNNWGRIDSH